MAEQLRGAEQQTSSLANASPHMLLPVALRAACRPCIGLVTVQCLLWALLLCHLLVGRCFAKLLLEGMQISDAPETSRFCDSVISKWQRLVGAQLLVLRCAPSCCAAVGCNGMWVCSSNVQHLTVQWGQVCRMPGRGVPCAQMGFSCASLMETHELPLEEAVWGTNVPGPHWSLGF